MTRGLSSSTISAISSDAFQIATLIKFDFSSPLLITDWPTNLTTSDGIFATSEKLIDVGGVEESAELRVNEFTIVLSGVDQTEYTRFITTNTANNRTTVWRAILSGGVIQGDPIMVFDGYITGYGIAENDSSATVEVKVASHWKDFEKVSGRRTNNASQQKFFPLDNGMEFAKELLRDIPWGRK